MKHDEIKVKPFPAIFLGLLSLCLQACDLQIEAVDNEANKVVATSKIVATLVQSKAVTLTHQYVCRIQSHKRVQVRALDKGLIEEIRTKEGQAVKQGDVLCQISPILHEAKLETELAEAQLAKLEFNYGKKLYEDKVVSQDEVALLQAKLAKANAKAHMSQAQLEFASVKAPFDGIVDRMHYEQGCLVQEGEVLTTLSDNSQMRVYFNVPEARYLEYTSNLQQQQDSLQIQLVLANGINYEPAGRMNAIDADFNDHTGNIAFSADFPNTDRLLRHGQTGAVVIRRVQKDAVVIPQRATFEILYKRYVYVVDQEDVVHQREIVVQNELDDIFVIKKGLCADEKIVLEGIRDVRDGEKVQYEDREPETVVANLKYHAE